MKTIESKAIDAIRVLSVDQVQAANSGHPGKPLGSAPMAYELWANHMNFDSSDSKWINRDRFILSAGHASALYYSLLHLFGYNLSLDDLKQFRQLGSLTPGHPELYHTDGVEATTGPLGAGLSVAVGMAMAQEHLAAKYNKDNYEILNNFTFVLSGDGCMMEGITSEASSLAGTLNLGRLIVMYDSNNITIEGDTDLAFTENVRARYEAYGFETFLVEDGNDLEALNRAISQAKANLSKPSFIEVKTKIGFGSPVVGSSQAHGQALGLDGVAFLKSGINYPSDEPFYVDPEVSDHFNKLVEMKKETRQEWNELFESYKHEFPELAKAWDKDFKKLELEDLLKDESLFEFDDKALSTRVASGLVINRLKDVHTNMFGGSADLASSTMTLMNGETSFSRDNYAGRNLHFGVRELAMAGIGNGLMSYGGLQAYVATFFVFADYLKPMARLSALSKLPLTYVLTHDSIGVGEDGPTHEPIEQLSMLRAMPNFITYRPADAKETAYGWALALSSKETPVGLVLSRQNLTPLERSGQDALKGAYVVYDSPNNMAIIMASGSEVSLAVESAKALKEEGIFVRVVSMPSQELFNAQSKEYKESILPIDMSARLAVEAGASLSWGQYVGLRGDTLCLDHFGASAPGPELFEAFGFTVDNVVSKVKALLD